MANHNWANAGKNYSMHVMPVTLDCNFIVDSTNGNGMGTRSLKGYGIKNVFMNTSAAFTGTTHTSTLVDGIAGGTSSLAVGMPVQGSGITAGTTIASIVSSGSITLSAATSSSTTGSITYQAVGNPNPGAGIILVQFNSTYNRYLYGASGFGSPVNGSPATSVTANAVYTIVSLGTTTTAQWVAAGLPIGILPAVGASFIASVTGAIGGTGAVEPPATAGSGITSVEVIGDPNQSLINVTPQGTLSKVSGGYMLLQCLAATSSSVTTKVATAPANNSTMALQFQMSNSSVVIAGE